MADGQGCAADCLSALSTWNCTGGTNTTVDICVTISDGIIVSPEVCDDNNTVDTDACSNSGVISAGYSCTGAPSVCVNTCGNGVKNATEGCDDGDVSSNDGCSSACLVEHGYTCDAASPNVCTMTCGDGVKAAEEGCDDNNTASNDGCSSVCAIEPTS